MPNKNRPKKTESVRPSVQGCNLARLRNLRGMSQRELAKASGVHAVQIANLERGAAQEMTRDNLERLATALGVGVPEITELKVEIIEAPAIDAYLRSDYAKDDRPTDEEVALLKSRAPAVFFGLDENSKAISALLAALRVASKSTH